MFVSLKALNSRHLTESFCQRGVDRERRCLKEEEAWVGDEADIIAYGIPPALVTSFRYLGRFLLAADEDWPAVFSNLQKSHQKWARLMQMLIRGGADTRILDGYTWKWFSWLCCTGWRCG